MQCWSSIIHTKPSLLSILCSELWGRCWEDIPVPWAWSILGPQLECKGYVESRDPKYGPENCLRYILNMQRKEEGKRDWRTYDWATTWELHKSWSHASWIKAEGVLSLCIVFSCKDGLQKPFSWPSIRMKTNPLFKSMESTKDDTDVQGQACSISAIEYAPSSELAFCHACSLPSILNWTCRP